MKLEDNGHKKDQKSSWTAFPTSLHLSRAAVFGVKGWLGGGKEFEGKECMLGKARGWDG